MSNIYGSDLWLGIQPDGSLDIDPTCREVSGIYVLAQSLVMRQTTPTGTVIGAPDDCFDIRTWISRGQTTAQLQQLGQQVQAQLLRDQRVLAVTVQAFFSFGTSTMTVNEQVTSGLGPFTLTVAVQNLTVNAFLNGQPLGGSVGGSSGGGP